MSQLEIFQVNVSDHVLPGVEHKLKIVWNYRGQPAPPYFIPVSILKDRAADVRAALQRLIDKGMVDTGRLERCGAELKDVAVAGYKLYKALFYRGDGFDASEIREWIKKEKATLDKKGQRIQINFVVDSLVHIPWGLVYDGSIEDLTGEPEQDTIDYYEDFWCLKFLVTSVYRRILPESLGISDPSSLTEILSVLNRAAFDKAVHYLTSPQDKILEWVEATFGKPIESSKEFFRAWQATGERCRVLYFYCHSNSTSLALSPDDSISLSDFRDETRLSGSLQQSTCVVFLNGCNTAVGDQEGAFLVATGDSLFCGFVGTETKIPDVFALRFGLAFLYCFLHEGWPIFQTMEYLRRQHWPIALTYSAYCPPMLRFMAIKKSLEIELTDNYSRMHMGTSQM